MQGLRPELRLMHTKVQSTPTRDDDDGDADDDDDDDDEDM